MRTMNLLGISGPANSGKDTFAKFLAPFGAVNVALADPLKQIAQAIYDFSDEQLWGPSAERNKPDKRYERPHTWQPVNEVEGYVCACCGEKRRLNQSHEEVPPCFLTPRYALQLLGTNYGRHCYENTWVVICVRTANHLLFGKPAQLPYVYPIDYDGPRSTYTGPVFPKYTAKLGLHDYKVQAEAHQTKLVTVSDVRFLNEIRTIQEAGGRVVRVRRPKAGLSGAAGLHPSEAEQMSIPDDEFNHVVENDGTLEELQQKAIEIGRALLG